MYRSKNSITASATALILRYVKTHFPKLPRQEKIEFLVLDILSALDNHDTKTAAEDLSKLAPLIPELKKGWDAALRTYDGKGDEKWFDTLFRYVFGNEKPRPPANRRSSLFKNNTTFS